jgi:hypothetical protein
MKKMSEEAVAALANEKRGDDDALNVVTKTKSDELGTPKKDDISTSKKDKKKKGSSNTQESYADVKVAKVKEAHVTAKNQ